MLGFSLTFSKVPRFGAGMHYYSEKYHQRFRDPGLEIVYVKRGMIRGRLSSHEFKAQPGSILVLPRELPFELFSDSGEAQSHATVWLFSDFKARLIELSERAYQENGGLILPLITPPSQENERIMKRLYAIIADSAESVEHERCVIGVISVLDELSRRARVTTASSSASILGYKIKRYLLANLDDNITLEGLAEHFMKTPNYLNYVFSKENGISIHQFIIRERLALLCEMLVKNVAFADACNAVGISDVSYGYRLFKKHVGLTPSEFIESKRY